MEDGKATPAPAPEEICAILTDNGSLRPEATLSLRRLATELSGLVGHTVHPVSLLHSHKIDPEALGGTPADTFERFVTARRDQAPSKYLVTPLFFGPSAAAYEYLPQRVSAIRSEHGWPELEVQVAPCLVDVAAPEDTRVARILADLVRETARAHGLDRPAVALCDHGAPRPKVTEVRNFLAGQLAALLRDEAGTISPCSMERREGDEYAFNEPLLENLLGSDGFTGNVVVSMLFFQPGRHAGANGDVAAICAEAEKSAPGLRAFMTDLVASHPDIVPVLAERFRQGLASAPVSVSGSA